MMVKRILVIINPISGYSRSRSLPRDLRERLESEGFEVDVHFTGGPGDGGRFAREHGDQCDLVIAAGGDGTIRDVAEGLTCTNIPLTIFPAGTENLFAQETKIIPDLEQLVQTVKWGRTVNMDMGQVDGRRFLLMAGVGFDGEVLIKLNRFRTGNITHLTYFWPIWRTFWEHNFPPMTIEADGQVVVESGRGLLFVSNIARYAVKLRICAKARQDDGLLDICFYRATDQYELLGHAWRTVVGRHMEHPGVVYRQAKVVRVTSPQAVPYQTDGDPAGILPAEFSVIPKALKVVVPPG